MEMMMACLEVFDPPLCCSTGVCGPVVDPSLTRFAADAEWLAAQGITVIRHNLAHEPQAFVANQAVSAALRDGGDAQLPLLLLDGAIVARGAYPPRAELARLVGLAASASRSKTPLKLASTTSCKPGSGCC
jgi:hypothetical protein